MVGGSDIFPGKEDPGEGRSTNHTPFVLLFFFFLFKDEDLS